MTLLALRGLAARRLRSVLTAMAVLLGVAMIAGTYVQTDQIRTAFEDIEQTANAGVDVQVRARSEFTSNFATPELLPESVLARVRAVPGVARADGMLFEMGSLVVDGEPLSSGFAPSSVMSLQPEPFNPFSVHDGRMPRGAGEVAVDRQLAEDEGLRPGDRVGLTTRRGVVPVTLVGVVAYGDVSIGGAQLVVARLSDVQAWYDRAGQLTEIAIAAQEGVSPEALAARVEAALPATYEVRTGERAAQESADEINDTIAGFLTPALLALAGASVMVGAFIIFNTFSITVAQRRRELAMLRAIGATRRQVVGAIAIEALLIGLTASLLGLLAGLGIARLLGALFDAAGMGIPRGAMELAPRTIAIALAVGVGVTLLSALGPAVRAMRVTPVEALADAPPRARGGRRRKVLSALVLAAGALLLAQGLFGGGTATARLGAMGAGTMAVFAGAALVAQALVRPLARVIGWPLERLGHATGELARENAAGNTARTATTAAALMVGLGLVVFVAVFAQGMKTSFTESVRQRVTADLMIMTDMGTPIPAGALDRIEAVGGVAATVGQQWDTVQVDGRDADPLVDVLSGTDPRLLPRMYDFDWVDGDDRLVARLGPGLAIAEEQFALRHGLARGEAFVVRGPAGREVRLRLLGTYRDPQILQGVVVDAATFGAVSDVTDPGAIYVAFDAGADGAAVRAGVERAMEAHPTAHVRDNDDMQRYVGEQLDRIVYLLYALLAMSLVVSLFGIANSLYLSVHERTRELGVLRAVGATASQVRRLVRYESVITSVIGGVLGTVIGVAFAFLTTLALDDWGLGFAVPAGQLALFLVLAVVVGVAGAVAPARRAARVDIVRAVGAGE